MTIRKTVTLIEETNNEYGAPASPPLRRVAIGDNDDECHGCVVLVCLFTTHSHAKP